MERHLIPTHTADPSACVCVEVIEACWQSRRAPAVQMATKTIQDLWTVEDHSLQPENLGVYPISPQLVNMSRGSKQT